MALIIEYQDTKFRVVGQELETNWLEDTYENRKVLVIILYLLQDKEGRGVFTLQELAEIIGKHPPINLQVFSRQELEGEAPVELKEQTCQVQRELRPPKILKNF